MLSGVSILCFAASYSVALVLEVSRLLFRSGVRGAVMLGFAAAGLLAHTAYLYYQAANPTGTPLSNEKDWYMVAAWVLAVVYLYLLCYHPRNSFGLFLLPLVLGLIAAGRFLAESEPFAREPASKVWGMLHGSSIVLAAVAVLVGFAAGMMYFGQAWRLKRKLLPGRGLRLPSLEWLERANHRAIVVSVIMLSMGVASGVILNVIRTDPSGGRLPWSDPLVLSTGLMLGWLLLSLLIGAVYKPARAGRKVAYLTVVSFLFLVLTLGVMLFLNTQHGGRGPGDTAHRLPSTAYRLRGRG
jgi:ABC-type uncharacterized transport system permease subunit